MSKEEKRRGVEERERESKSTRDTGLGYEDWELSHIAAHLLLW